MGWKDFFSFGKKKEESIDPLKIELKDLKKGWMVDYDMTTWEVKAHHRYDWGSGSFTDEWELHSSDKIMFLHHDPEDGGEFTLSYKIPIGKIEGNVKEHFKTHEDGPGQIVYEGTTYYLDDDGGGLFLENGQGPEQEFIYWDYEDEKEERFVTIEQWGENEFEAYAGIWVEDYNFENILPR
jgi:hypothetical protein